MRMTQNMGLTGEAQAWLLHSCNMVTTVTCPNCGHPVTTGIEKKFCGDAKDLGMFDDGPDLYEYILRGGSKVKEVVQAAPWDCGPMIYLCLQNEKGEKMFLWPDIVEVCE